MVLSDTLDMMEFGLSLEDELLSDALSIPDWNLLPQTLPYSQQVQWPQQQQDCMWQNTASAEAAVLQPDINEVPCVMQTIPQNCHLLQSCQYRTLKTPTQVNNLHQASASASQLNSTPVKTNQTFFSRGPARSHRAQITIVSNPGGTSRAIIKRKRKRTAFTTEQVLALERVFSKKPYVNRDERQALVEQLQVTDRAVKVWFQNRRIKSKREEMEASSSSDFSPTATASDSSDSFSLAYVEAQMQQKTDEFGYVTLDDRAMGELVNVIDALVSENVQFNVLSEENVVENVLTTEYEPISPAANSDCSGEETAQWKPPEPEQSLRQLLDSQPFC